MGHVGNRHVTLLPKAELFVYKLLRSTEYLYILYNFL